MTASEPVIDALTYDDIPRCAMLEKVIYGDDSPWPASAFRAELNAPYNTYFAAREEPGGEIIGYAGISTLGQPEAYECEIHTISVDPRHHGKGIGKALLEAMLAVADEVDAPVYLEVRTDNDPAIALYSRHGFTTVGLRRGYYQPSGADAYTMLRAPSSGRPIEPEEGPA
ncbi:ribosomal protein S18-alanine N-acetyltransferase [Gordonia paraffinivorans]|uniref:ribosomal protein S18-alanine N-acetyltransferase n=1 Tax=Gordonia paraffinivorans TaxID=175628 RepID=UPI003FCC6914